MLESNGQWLLGQFVQRSGNLAVNPANSRTAQELNFFHQDVQGSTAALSDANGQILDRMAKASLGNGLNNTGLLFPLPNHFITIYKRDLGTSVYKWVA